MMLLLQFSWETITVVEGQDKLSRHQEPHTEDSTPGISMWDSGPSNQNLRALLKWMRRQRIHFLKENTTNCHLIYGLLKIQDSSLKSNCLIF